MAHLPRSAGNKSWPAVRYTQTQLGGGVTAQGVAFPGGLDLTTPSLRLQAGALTDVLNFEVAQSGGYARIGGIERFDGHPSPSAGTYTIVQVASFTNVPALADVVTQATSGATGTIIAIVETPTPYLVLSKVTGVFDITHSLTIPGPITVGTAAALTASIDSKTSAIYTAAAADLYRLDIAAVPGSGAILGVVAMAFSGVDHVYAFRANVGNTATAIYKSSAAGWVLVPFYNLIAFTAGGTAVPLDGDTLTQGGVTATIKRVMWQSGAWAGSAVGQFVITNPAGGNFAAGAATTTSGATLTLSGVQTAITMAPAGRFQFDKGNFSGQLVTRRIYGCDGVNPPFEFDGDTMAPIKTGLSPNQPSNILIHKNYLFISQDASIFYSGPGTPFKWSAVDGAGEIATGDTVTGLITLPGTQTTATLCIFLRTNTSFLYGTDPTTFNYVAFPTGIGAAPYSAQNLSDTFFLADLGAVTLKTTLNYGNFLPTTLTKNILPFIKRQRGNLKASTINREKSQFRLFFEDGYGLFLTVINQQYLGAGIVLYPSAVNCVDNTKLTTDDEVNYAGAADGFVYQLDVGTSLDGEDLSAYFVTAWDPVRSPRIIKHFRAASVEVQGDSYAEFQYGFQLGYGSDQIPQDIPGETLPINLSGTPLWDSFTWDRFTWDGSTLTPTDIEEPGDGENIRVIIASSGNYIAPYTVNSIIHHYTMRRGLRP